MGINVKTVRAFQYPEYDYYRLTCELGPLPEGTIFFHDPDDHVYGSQAAGCLKNCWTADGNCSGSICGGTVILHYCFVDTDLFEKVERTDENLINSLRPGHYEIDVCSNGEWKITKHGGGMDS